MRLLLFDIDMTLIRTLGAGRGAMELAFRDLFGIEKATEGISFDGRTDRGIFAEALERHGKLTGDADGAVSAFTEAYLGHLPQSLATIGGMVLPGVEALLDRLAGEGLPLGLATGNVRRGAALKLGHFGLWDRFAAGGFGDSTAIRSELVAEGIRALAAVAGTDANPAETIVLGDTPLDVQAAERAGARSMGVATGRYGVDELRASGATFAVPDLSDTDAVAKLLLGPL